MNLSRWQLNNMQDKEFSIQPILKRGPLFDHADIKDTKDPCIAFDGKIWHIFGSVGTTKSETWQLLHATSQLIDSGWSYKGIINLEGLTGQWIAAPSGKLQLLVLYHHLLKK
jgi:hypothetical protein